MRKPGYQTEPASPTRLTTLAWINNLLLMFVGLIPFGTLLIGIFGFTTTTALAYGANLFLVQAMYWSLWLYASCSSAGRGSCNHPSGDFGG